MQLDFSMTEQQKRIAVIVGIVSAILLIVGLWLIFKPKNYSSALAVMQKIKQEMRPPTAEELIEMAPLLKHPDRTIAAEANQYFSIAPPDAITTAAQKRQNFEPEIRDQFDGHWVNRAPREAIVQLLPELSNPDPRNRTNTLTLVLSSGQPEASVALEKGLEENDETNLRMTLTIMEARPELIQMGKGFRSKLEKIANDPNSGSNAFHAKRVLNKMAGGRGDIPYPGSDDSTRK